MPDPVEDQAEQVAIAMQNGRSFADAMDSHGGKELAEELGGRFEFGKSKTDKIHSLAVTPEMRACVLSEGQPLFSHASESIPATTAKDIQFELKPTQKGLPPYLRLNAAASEAINRALGVRVLGVNIDARMVPELVTKLKAEADKLAKTKGVGEMRLRALANAMLDHADKNSGLNIIRASDNEAEQLGTLHEEMLHSGQRAAGSGDLRAGVPWKQTLSTPGMAKMAGDRIIPGLLRAKIAPHPSVVVAEGLVDIMRGDAWELTAAEAEHTAEKYFEAMATQHGIESVQRIQDIEDYIAAEAAKLGVKYGRPSVREAGQRALAGVLSGKTGAGIQRPRESQPAKTGGTTGSGEATGHPPGDTGQGLVRSGATHEGGALASTQPIGLTDEELDTWSKSKGFRVEPAGEQLGMFGGNEPVLRVFRSGPRGKEQRGLIYQNQLDKLSEKPQEGPAEPFALTGDEAQGGKNQPALFGAGDMGEIIGPGKSGKTGIQLPEKESKSGGLFSDESGSLEPGKAVAGIANAAGHVGDLLRQEIADNRRAKELQWDMYDLDKRHEARVLRAKQLLQSLKKDGVSQEDRQAIDEHLDALQADSDHVPVPSLTTKQDEILDTVLMPMKAEAEQAFKKVTGAGMTIPNYNPRQTKGRGGMLDRFLTPQGEKRTGRGNLMSTTNPATKHRVMMAIEREGVKSKADLFGAVPGAKPKPRSGKIFGELPDRVVVSLKGGQVTAWDKGTPENLGPILHSEEGGRFVDKDGSIWKLKQATKKEIEAHTNLEYYHDAAASTVVNWLQAKRAEAAHDFLEKFKKEPEFREIAMAADAGNPPKGWRTTNLPQMKGYYFEPHTAEALDWFKYRKIKISCSAQRGLLEGANEDGSIGISNSDVSRGRSCAVWGS
jgi:hypothetical protein